MTHKITRPVRKSAPAFVVVVVLLIVSLLSVLLVGALYSDPLRASPDEAFADRFDALRADAAIEVCAHAFIEAQSGDSARQKRHLVNGGGTLAESVTALAEACAMTPLITTKDVRVFDVTLSRGRANAHKRVSLRRINNIWRIQWLYDVRG